MKILIRENKPCLYELSWNPETPAIIFKIHKDVIKEKGSISDDAPIIMGLKETFGFDKFLTDFGGNFGFGGAFKNCGEDGEFIKFAVDIPIIESKGDKCEDCNGSGVDEDRNSECLYCSGSGKKSEYDWDLSYSISASFTVLFIFLCTFEKETRCKFPQLLEVDTITQKGIHGGWISGRFSVPLVNWLKTFNSSKEIPEIKKATIRAHKYMFCSSTELDNFDFRVILGNRNGKITIDCPGNACGIHPGECYDYGDKVCGYEFTCHNVDSPAQQLTLLAGLAALHDRARKEIKSY